MTSTFNQLNFFIQLSCVMQLMQQSQVAVEGGQGQIMQCVSDRPCKEISKLTTTNQKLF